MIWGRDRFEGVL